MARVLVCTAQVPFASGGAERHAAGLVRELDGRGHEAELVQLPFKWYPREEILDVGARVAPPRRDRRRTGSASTS